MPRYFVTLIVAVALFMETMDSTVIATSLLTVWSVSSVTLTSAM